MKTIDRKFIFYLFLSYIMYDVSSKANSDITFSIFVIIFTIWLSVASFYIKK
jgi:hypothetical protein